MELPIIKKIKNEFSLIQKNFTQINRYNSMFNKYKLICSPHSTNNSKSKLINSKISTSKNSIIRNNNLYKNNKSFSNKEFYSKIFKPKNNLYFSSLSPSMSHKKYNFISLSKNASTSYNSLFPASSIINNLSSERHILKPNKSTSNLIIPKKKETQKIDKILTKFKLNKIISNNSDNSCYIQEVKHNLFVNRHKKLLSNEKFINSQIKKHRHFLFDKNEDSIHKMNKYLIDIDNSNTLKENLSSEDILKSLNKNDIKLIKSDVTYFKDVNENIIKDIMKIKSNTIGLLDILKKEGQKDDEEKIVKKIKKENKKINLKENFIYNYDKYIRKILNDDLDQRLKAIEFKKEIKKIHKIMKDCSSKINIDIGKLSSARNIRFEDKCFRTFFIHLKDEMKRQYYLNRNRERLAKEKSFQNKKDLKIKEEENEKNNILMSLEKYKNGLNK